ncbi:MAG: SUMF1/EgtB/PvdO family nonheme iron enzyme [candidate division NC10 bacterium]|nr:SUMF1/EgtB/PvdO family nonheme iron enzyme [candidate division NC10 bacterium]
METEPQGASVEVDSGEKGLSPAILEVPAGPRKLKVSREGYQTQSLEVVVSVDGVARIQVKLSPTLSVGVRTERKGRDQAEMVWIPEGESQASRSGFWIDRYEVSNAQYARFLQETGHEKPAYWEDPKYNRPELPVVGVSWNDASAYARWAGKRLPTGAEWEKAAGGLDGRAYPWGDTWGADRCNSLGTQDGFEGPAPVGSFPLGASPYGVMDMAGNVWEWVAEEPKQDASAGAKDICIGRGGSWANPREGVTVISQARGNATLTDCIIGFRCAMDAE